jgi:phage-related protein
MQGFNCIFVQMGQDPAGWKPMKIIGAGAVEIRVHKEGEWRIIYVAKFLGKVCVLHAFEKKTQKTRQSDIALVRERYKEVENREKAKQKSRW